MSPITIPRSQVKEDLVIITRSEYDSLLSLAKDDFEELNELEESIAQVKKGQTAGPFGSAEDLTNSLNL